MKISGNYSNYLLSRTCSEIIQVNKILFVHISEEPLCEWGKTREFSIHSAITREFVNPHCQRDNMLLRGQGFLLNIGCSEA